MKLVQVLFVFKIFLLAQNVKAQTRRTNLSCYTCLNDACGDPYNKPSAHLKKCASTAAGCYKGTSVDGNVIRGCWLPNTPADVRPQQDLLNSGSKNGLVCESFNVFGIYEYSCCGVYTTEPSACNISHRMAVNYCWVYVLLVVSFLLSFWQTQT